MTEKFTLEDLFIKIIPGGIVVGILFFELKDQLNLEIVSGLDFFYTFLFFTFSFLAGEILQTISHEIEWIIFSFFKFYKPSEIFLYKDNPVLKNEHIRQNILNKLNLSVNEVEILDTPYKSLPVLWWKREKQSLTQSIFWKLYSNVSSDNEVKTFNRNYLFVRAIVVVFMILSIFFAFNSERIPLLLSIILLLLFLWRARGMARTLIFKTVILNLKIEKI